MNSRTRKPLALPTIAAKNGISIVRDELGFVDYSRREKLSAKTTQVLWTVRTELGNIDNLEESQKVASDKLIPYKKTKLEQTGDEFSRRHVAERLCNLEEERSAHVKAASSNRKALHSQISRIRETIDQVFNNDTTLADKIKTLFREQGIIIASILTALGFIISTLTLTLTGGGTGSGDQLLIVAIAGLLYVSTKNYLTKS